jgi:hypothetical protein
MLTDRFIDCGTDRHPPKVHNVTTGYCYSVNGNDGVSDKTAAYFPPQITDIIQLQNSEHLKVILSPATKSALWLITNLQMYNSEILDAIFMIKYNVLV